MNKLLKLLLILLAVLILAVIGFVILIVSIVPNNWPEQRPFNASIWKFARETDYNSPRAGMIDDLLAKDRLRSMTRQEVLNLLGPPDTPDDRIITEEKKITTAMEYQYSLGAWSGFRVDDDVLSIYFDEHGRVKNWSVWQG